mmetsp:Transcript_14921/g.33164  ORF Transcript_14921/g.33164 Transcript_14921/m.33164 type:complete len:346 (-) Transcript_14921:870-1907(-)
MGTRPVPRPTQTHPSHPPRDVPPRVREQHPLGPPHQRPVSLAGAPHPHRPARRGPPQPPRRTGQRPRHPRRGGRLRRLRLSVRRHPRPDHGEGRGGIHEDAGTTGSRPHLHPLRHRPGPPQPPRRTSGLPLLHARRGRRPLPFLHRPGGPPLPHRTPHPHLLSLGPGDQRTSDPRPLLLRKPLRRRHRTRLHPSGLRRPRRGPQGSRRRQRQDPGGPRSRPRHRHRGRRDPGRTGWGRTRRDQEEEPEAVHLRPAPSAVHAGGAAAERLRGDHTEASSRGVGGRQGASVSKPAGAVGAVVADGVVQFGDGRRGASASRHHRRGEGGGGRHLENCRSGGRGPPVAD